MCLFVSQDSNGLSGLLNCFYNRDIILIKILIMVNTYADFKFSIYKFILFIFIVVVYKLVNRLLRIQNEPRDFVPTSPSVSVASRRMTPSQRSLRDLCSFVLATTPHN